MSVQTFSNFSADAVTFIAQKTLMIAKKSVVFQQLGDKAQLGPNNSKTFQYTRYDRLALPRNPLTEGVTPDNTSVQISTVQAVAEQWGAYVNLSDVAVLTIKHPVMVKAIDLMGYQAAETMDREIIEVLLAGTSVSYPLAVTSRSGLSSTTTDVMSTDLIRRVVSGLRTQGAHEYEGQDFVGVIDPQVEMDISKDSTFVTAASYSNIKVLWNGEAGKWMGVRWMRSNFIPTLSGLAAASYTTPASPAGTFTAANYRVLTAYYNARTGFLEKVTQNANVAFAALDSLAGTTPADSNYVYKIFVSAAAAAAGAIMYVGSDSVYGTDFIPANTAFSIVDPPISGESFADVPQTGAVVHFSWIFGKEAYSVVDLQKLATYVTPNQASDSDPLAQRRKAGWKMMFKAVICNEEFLERMETLSAF